MSLVQDKYLQKHLHQPNLLATVFIEATVPDVPKFEISVFNPATVFMLVAFPATAPIFI